MKKAFLHQRPKRASYAFALLVCLLLFSAARAQFHFDSYSTDNGLPQNGVRSINQTPDGYLWFTTFDGLVRFDGVKFTVYDRNNSPGILSNRFFQLHVEPDGTLYAGAENGNFTIYRNGVFKTLTIENGLPSERIAKFIKDTSGEFVMSTFDRGHFYFRDDKFVPVPQSELPAGGLFYVGAKSGTWIYGTEGISQKTRDGREIKYDLKLNYFNENYSGILFFEDGVGDVWVGDLTGVHRLRDGQVTSYDTSTGVPDDTLLRPSLQDNAGAIWSSSGWFGYTRKVGLVRYYQDKFTTWGEQAGLSNLSVGSIFKDSEGTIWVGSDGGIHHLRQQIIRAYSVNDGLAYKEVYPLLRTRNGDIYVGTVQGLNRYRDGKFSDVALKYDENYLSVTSLGEDRDGNVWMADSVGLYKLENDRLRKIDAIKDIAIWTIKQDRNGIIWLGTVRGLIALKDEKILKHFTVADGLPGDDVKIVHEDRNGSLWVGTYGGLAKISPNGGSVENVKFENLTTAEGLASDRVRTIHEDDEGLLWIGTYDGGLSRLKDGKLFSYTVEDGLFTNGVFQILEDAKNNFWISCNRGVYRVSRQELNDKADGKILKVNSAAYGKQDGMLNTECNGGRQPAGVKDDEGKVWFPTQDGVIVINPDDVVENPKPPPVQIETALVERQQVDIRKGIELNANDDTLEIRYTGISFIKSEFVKFRYRIEGLNNEWTDVGTIRELYFPSLPSGEYVFHVIAANSDGVWNERGARLNITVLAPFWQKPWFLILSTLVLLAAIVFAFRLRVKELERRQKVQQEFSRKLLESQEQERQRIAAELHDSIGQSLLIIKNRAFLALSDLDEPDMVKEQLEELSDSATNAIEECREISYNLRPYQIDRFGLTKTLEAIFKRISDVTEAEVTTNVDQIDDLFSPEAETNIYRVVQETVNNIIKHSAATEASLTIRSLEHKVEIRVYDNGRGFDPGAKKGENERGGFGMISIAERVRMLGGNLEIDSAPGKGTTIQITIADIKDDN